METTITEFPLWTPPFVKPLLPARQLQGRPHLVGLGELSLLADQKWISDPTV